jgi:hypothetical protein
MVIYNVTNKVDKSISAGWLHWLQQEHIPEMIKTGCFTHATILHLYEMDDSDGITYAVQYHTIKKDLYTRYIEKYAGIMQKKSKDKWGEKIISFRTVMQVVN